MAVYSVKWNPFHPRVFLSCSADWTVSLRYASALGIIVKLNEQYVITFLCLLYKTSGEAVGPQCGERAQILWSLHGSWGYFVGSLLVNGI